MIGKINLNARIKVSSPISEIYKESIKNLHFPKGDVLVSSFDQIMRMKNLEGATKMGNISHTKVLISFEDIEGQKKVETTIWGYTDTHVILKGDLLLPIRRINSIHY